MVWWEKKIKTGFGRKKDLLRHNCESYYSDKSLIEGIFKKCTVTKQNVLDLI